MGCRYRQLLSGRSGGGPAVGSPAHGGSNPEGFLLGSDILFITPSDGILWIRHRTQTKKREENTSMMEASYGR